MRPDPRHTCCAQDTSIFRDANANVTSSSGVSASGGNVVTSRDHADAASPATAPADGAGPASAAAAGPAGAASAVVGYGTSTFHVDLTASPGVSTNATGLVYINVNPQENRCAHMLPWGST